MHTALTLWTTSGSLRLQGAGAPRALAADTCHGVPLALSRSAQLPWPLHASAGGRLASRGSHSGQRTASRREVTLQGAAVPQSSPRPPAQTQCTERCTPSPARGSGTVVGSGLRTPSRPKLCVGA